jgi:hypothetical protein
MNYNVPFRFSVAITTIAVICIIVNVYIHDINVYVYTEVNLTLFIVESNLNKSMR